MKLVLINLVMLLLFGGSVFAEIQWSTLSSVSSLEPACVEAEKLCYVGRARINIEEDGVIKQALLPGKYFAWNNQFHIIYRGKAYHLNLSQIEVSN